MVKKLIITTILFAAMSLLPVKTASADYIAGSSAAIKKDGVEATSDIKAQLYIKKLALKSVLESYNSNLVSSIDSFLTACQKYNLNCYLLPSITGVESFFGKFMIQGTYNPFGWGAGRIYFKSWDDGIDTVASGLRKNYINKGADTVEKIGPIYATTTTWAPKVISFMRKFEKEEEKYLLFFNNNTLEL